MKKTFDILSLFGKINKLAMQDPRIKQYLAWAFVLTGIIALFPTGNSYVMSQIMNRLQTAAKDHVATNVQLVAMVYLLLMFIPITLRTISGRIVGKMNSFLSQRFSIVFKSRMADLDYAYFDDSQFHDKIKNVREKGVDTTYALFGLQFALLDIVISIALGMVAVSFLGSRYVAVLVVAVIPLLILELWKKKNRKIISDQNRTDYRHANAYGDEAGTRESRVFTLASIYMDRYKGITDGIIERFARFEDKRALFDLIGLLFLCLGVVVVVYHAFISIATGTIMIGSGYFILSGVWTFVNSLREGITFVAAAYENIMYSEEFFEIIELPRMVTQSENAKVIRFSKGPSIIFENVSFSYPGKEKPALMSASFQISSGAKVSLVGENGGGKSTAIKLLLRFYDPAEGRILIDGQDLKDLDIDSWRNAIGYVAQSPSIPNLKLRSILSHETDLAEELLVRSSARSRADEFIINYRNKYDQQIGKMFKGGVSPSDGQRQRIAIARAFTKNPNLLIFDEPTADLDPETQHHVFDDFYKNNPHTTGILVAHALQGVMRSDRVYVFEKGRLTQTGSHRDLIDVPGWYQSSFKKQSEAFQTFMQ